MVIGISVFVSSPFKRAIIAFYFIVESVEFDNACETPSIVSGLVSGSSFYLVF